MKDEPDGIREEGGKMAYRKDPDLEFLGNVPSAKLDPLVRILTEDKDGDERLTEELTAHDRYKLKFRDSKYLGSGDGFPLSRE